MLSIWRREPLNSSPRTLERAKRPRKVRFADIMSNSGTGIPGVIPSNAITALLAGAFYRYADHSVRGVAQCQCGGHADEQPSSTQNRSFENIRQSVWCFRFSSSQLKSDTCE